MDFVFVKRGTKARILSHWLMKVKKENCVCNPL
jgi:hypothetical protein